MKKNSKFILLKKDNTQNKNQIYQYRKIINNNFNKIIYVKIIIKNNAKR